jgi:PAS domain S-box-containing protein
LPVNYSAIVIGTSAGGLAALTTLLGGLSPGFPIPVIVVQHRAKEPGDLLEEVLQSKCLIKIKQADEKEKISGGIVYIAPPDYHLLVENDQTFSLSSDELIRFSRPSIDVLFDSAAKVFKDKLVGILLTGSNSDGAAGITTIKEYGGLTIAQSPGEAEFSAMPAAAVATNNVKYIWTLAEIYSFLNKLAETKMEKKDKAVILIVDDKPANILALESLLEAKDRVILNATSGNDALKISLNEEIDLIILDVQMPGMDGFEVAQILKLNKRTRDIPVIFASAERKEQKFMLQGFEEGAVDYLFKPLDPAITRAKVSILLKLQLQKKELLEKNLSLEKSALLINNSADIIGIIDSTALKIEEINKAFTGILGYSQEETRETALTSFLSNEDCQMVRMLSESGKEQHSFETRVYCKDQTIKWLQWNVVAKYGKWFVNARDITEIKIANEQISHLNTDLQNNIVQLEATNKELESFSYSISHDLRAPLRAVGWYSQKIEKGYSQVLDEEAKRLLKNIQDNADRMDILINELLAFSKLGRKPVEKTEIDMQKMVENILPEIRNPVTPNNPTIIVNALPPARADRNLLNQVWTNLIANAVKYSAKKEKPVVEIGGSKSENEITYYIKDNGAGFDLKYAENLFGVFQRLHRADEFEGTGVGLAIVNRIITKHGGRVWAEAVKNEGATFFFTLPV